MPTKICVLGLGYVGLPTAAVFATTGADVVGVDVDPKRVNDLRQGGGQVEEPGLRTLVQAAVHSGHLGAQAVPEPADAFIIAVGTPLGARNTADLAAVRNAAEWIVPHLRPGNTVVLESTVPPGTTETVLVPILERTGMRARPDGGRREDFYVAHCPERVLPGNIIRELIDNDRVIGGLTPAAAEAARGYYQRFANGHLYLTDARTAELVKLAENVFRDLNIALANELAGACEALGANVWDVIELANRHPRVRLLRPGPGVGGHCISVDPWFLIHAVPESTRLMRLAREVNDRQPARVAERVRKMTAGIAHPKVAILGVAYKGGVGDARGSPAIPIVAELRAGGHDVVCCDPHVTAFVWPLRSLEDALAGSDCAVIVADHEEFLRTSPADVRTMMRTPQILDTRGRVPVDTWRQAGLRVVRLGDGRGDR